MQSAMQNTSVRQVAVAPFRAPSKSVCSHRRSVVVQASQEPADYARKAGAVVAAAVLSLTPMSALAAEQGLQLSVGSPEQLQDKASSAAQDAASALKQKIDPRNVDTSVAGNALREAGKNVDPRKAINTAFSGASGLQVNVSEQIQQKAQDAAKGAANKLKQNVDPRNVDTSIAGNALREAGKNADPRKATNTAFSGSNSLQVNVSEQIQQKAQDAAKGAADKLKQNVDPRNIDTSIAGNALREAGKNADPRKATGTAFSGVDRLQVNVSEQIQQQAQDAAKGAADKLKQNVDPRNVDTSIAGNALREAGKNADPRKATGTAFSGAGSLQVNVSEKIQQKAQDAAKSAADTLKQNVDPRNVDTSIAGNALREAGKNADPRKATGTAFNGAGSLQVNVSQQIQQKAQDAAKGAADKLKQNVDPRNVDTSIAGNALREAGKNADPRKATSTAFNSAGSLQVNVSEQIQQKAQDAAKGAADKLKQNVDPRNVDTSIAGNALREAGKNANPQKATNTSFSDTNSLQVNI